MKSFPIPSAPAPSGGERPPTTSKFGATPQAASYAAGGPVLGRTREFLKEPVVFRAKNDEAPKGDGSVDDDKLQTYGKPGGDEASGNKNPEGKDKSMKTVMPRK